mmetsp:Transcript_7257/g.17700  ORF Transcript_7257/g.17700 Transcript_7257/m.17700 type:complete len:339 (-) Transcript_7257:237-1253(-)|eukprot:CAMPEP_0197192508 /NCGR_PEP_ID=MMETSP1423-20130617/25189_1 /TAXON_ID=476441 /ORGANISM="Pseudo-nitzschia heimii, Strain UNC1101" /LENGTH=338 /DNA_ID=CAMNT_0042645405 /DNA_START=89 /DNA_END=1105 /DNA_ORIENTATION=+
MKIFAKRTKKKAEPSGPRKVNKSDPVVEELLKKDPSEWNAKEKRMVKRYRERKVQETNEQPDIMPTNKADRTEDADKENAAQNENVKEETKGDDNSSSSDVDEKTDDESDKEMDKDGNTSIGDTGSSIKMETQHTTTGKKDEIDTSDRGNSIDNNDNEKVPKNHEIWSVLDKLNSKQKRTLSRKLDRVGISGLEEIEEEANNILDKIMPMDVDSNRDTEEATNICKETSKETTESKKKKRKRGADWSSLPTEERLRREEQRRKQQEAAERRARGESIKPGHKRPLNSARRRANRRKPKWASKSQSGAPDISDYKTEHHSSGFVHRKNRHARTEVANNH